MTRSTMRCTLPVALCVALLATAAARPTLAEGDESAAGPVLNRAVVARGVEGHLPLGTEGPFVADGDRLYIYLEVANPGAEQVLYTVNWHHLDRDRSFSQTIEVGHGPRWRTWVYHRMGAGRLGRWHVDVVAPGGQVQAELDFELVAAPAEPGLQAPVAASASR
jgi:hypothetical protein